MTFYYAKEKFSQSKPKVFKDLDQVFLQFNEQWVSPQFEDPRLLIELQKLTLQFFEREWIFLKNVNSVLEQQGPFSAYEIFLMLKKSTLISDTLIWKKGFSQWKKISETNEFCELFGKVLESSQEEFERTQSETADIIESILEMQRVVDQNRDKNSGPTDENVVLIVE